MARHHKSMKHHANDGNDVLKSRPHEGYYAGESARRTQEMEDAEMIHSDFKAVANMPQDVMYKPYPMAKNYLPEGLDDSIKGVDYQENLDDRKRSMHNVPKKV